MDAAIDAVAIEFRVSIPTIGFEGDLTITEGEVEVWASSTDKWVVGWNGSRIMVAEVDQVTIWEKL